MYNFATMNVEELREYCLSLDHVEEAMPFGDDTLVFKVGGKMFALLPLDGTLRINLKCDPDEAVELRETYAAVKPGFHMNKRHWNTVLVNGSVSDGLLKKWIGNSYDLIIAGLSKKEKAGLGL